jgi:sugar-phosphatase
VTVSANRQLALQYDDLSDVIAAPGAHEVLAVLAERGLPWAVVTSADLRLAQARLAAAGIGVPVLVTIDDLSAGKPDPAGYLLGASLLGVPPAGCLVVEDAEVGLRAARAAGCPTAALRGLDGDLRIADLHELATLLRVG